MPAESYHRFPLAPRNRTWNVNEALPRLKRWASKDGSGDKDQIDWQKYRQVFFWHESSELQNFGQFKFPYADIIDGEPHVVHNAVQNALARLDNSNIPDNDKDDVRRVAQRQLNRFNSEDNMENAMFFKSGTPTQEQLNKIVQRIGADDLSTDDFYVIENLMIDTLPTSYYSRIDESLLRQFERDTLLGIPLLKGHDDSTLPLGRSFDGYIKYDDIDGAIVPTLYGWFYIPRGYSSDGNNTDDIIKGIQLGLIRDTSVGFVASDMICSICGNDIRDFMNCPHWPGEKYDDETCYVIMKNGYLIEDSIVYSGAAPRAHILSAGQYETSKEYNIPIPNLKLVSPQANVLGTFSKSSGAMYFVSNPQYIRSLESEGNSLESITGEMQEQVVQEQAEQEESQGQVQQEINDVANEEFQLDELVIQLDAKKAEITQLQAEITKLQAEVEQLKAQNAELNSYKVIAEQYKDDLVNDAVKYAVRLMGNAFDADAFKTFLSNMSVDAIKAQKDAYKQEFQNRFGNVVQFTKQRDIHNVELDYDAMSEEEKRAYIAAEATKLANSKGISYKEAARQIITNISKKEN